MPRQLAFGALLIAGALNLLPHTARAQDATTQPQQQQAVREIKVASDAFVRGTPLPAWAAAPAEIPATRRSNPVVLRLAETQVHAGSVSSYLVNRAVQVNESSALGTIGQYPLHFAPQYQKLSLHSLRILRGNEVIDRTREAGVRFLERETNLESGVYAGLVTAMLLIEDVRVGDTLHIVYSTEGSNPVFGSMFSESMSWDQSEPTELRRVTVRFDAQRKLTWKLHGDYRGTSVRPEETTEGRLRSLRFEERGIEGLDYEPNIPNDYIAARYLQVTEYRTWNAVAQWATGLFPAGSTLPQDMRPVVESLRSLATPEEQAAKALQWVQDEIRYFSVSMGESSHRPYPPEVVWQRRFGDCKDKTLLLVTLLRELGIEATPVLVSAQNRRLPARQLPNPDVFDHVVAQVRIKGSTYYLDGTRLGQRGSLARMGMLLEGASALVVSPETTELTTLSARNATELATSDLREIFTLPAFDGDGRLETRYTWQGGAAEVMRLVYSQLTPEQRRKQATGMYERRYPGISLEGDASIKDDEAQNTFSIEWTFKVPQLAKELSGYWGMRFFPDNLVGSIRLPQKLNRAFPAQVANLPFRAKYQLAVHWPENVSVMRDPIGRRLNTDFFQVDVQRSFRGNVANVHVQYTPKVENVAPKDLTRLLEDIGKLENAVGGVVAVETAAIKSNGFLGIGKKTLQQTMLARIDKAIAATTKAIQGGELKGDDLAESLCARAEAYADRGTPLPGLKDAEAAVKEAPSLGRAWQCRANLLFTTGEYAKAIGDYTKALSLGSEAFHTLYRRGHARYYAGQYEAAAADFGRAAELKLSTNEADSLYAVMWQVWALQRGRQGLPANIQELALKDPAGPWPRPALAMLVGSLSPDEVLAQANRKQGDEREMTLAEAWFYVGQHYQSQGQLPKAREAYEKSREKGITMYIEHHAAGLELERMK
jgi:tetratricopeptide (TPR) repeat protein